MIAIGDICTAPVAPTGDYWWSFPCSPGEVHVIETLAGTRVPFSAPECVASPACGVFVFCPLVNLDATHTQFTVPALFTPDRVSIHMVAGGETYPRTFRIVS